MTFDSNQFDSTALGKIARMAWHDRPDSKDGARYRGWYIVPSAYVNTIAIVAWGLTDDGRRVIVSCAA